MIANVCVLGGKKCWVLRCFHGNQKGNIWKKKIKRLDYLNTDYQAICFMFMEILLSPCFFEAQVNQ